MGCLLQGGADAGVQVDLIGRVTRSSAHLGERVYLACSSTVWSGIAFTVGSDTVPEIAGMTITSVVLAGGMRWNVDFLAGRHVQHTWDPRPIGVGAIDQTVDQSPCSNLPTPVHNSAPSHRKSPDRPTPDRRLAPGLHPNRCTLHVTRYIETGSS